MEVSFYHLDNGPPPTTGLLITGPGKYLHITRILDWYWILEWYWYRYRTKHKQINKVWYKIIEGVIIHNQPVGTGNSSLTILDSENFFRAKKINIHNPVNKKNANL
jgi:hypothetical protein